MAETLPAEKIMHEIPTQPPIENLPTVTQTRKPSVKRALGKDAEHAAAAFPPKIAAAILKVTREVGHIQKFQPQEGGFIKYAFSRWEDVSERLSPLLAEHGLIIWQEEVSRDLIEANDKGSVLAIVYSMKLISEDGQESPAASWTGIARLRDQKGIQDDKAALKCQTQAEKSFCLKLFKIRTSDGLGDDDKHAPLTRADARPIYKKFLDEINECQSLVQLEQWKKDNLQRVRDTLKDDWLEMFNTVYNERKHDLTDLSEYVDGETGEVS